MHGDTPNVRIVTNRCFSNVGDKSMLGKGAGGDLDKIEAEDQEIVEATQRGVGAGAYDRGRYSPTRETGVHHFHRMLTKTL